MPTEPGDKRRLQQKVHDVSTAPFEKKTGISHFFAAASYSRDGFLRLLQEAAFRQELGFFVAILLIFLLVGASAGEFMVVTVLFLALFAIEAINTAIEELVDRISPEISSVGKHAKDLGSFAVLCTVLSASLYALVTVTIHLFA